MAGPGENGWAAEKVFEGAQNGFAFDDVMFMPGHVSFDASEVELSGRLTKHLTLRTPIISSPLDTVTEAEMAISMALAGGMGVIHANQSIEAQAEMVKAVKRHVNGFILEPFVMGPTNTLADLDKLKADKGVGAVPITDNGKLGGKLLGWVGARESDTVQNRARELQHFMVRKVLRGTEPLSLEDATELLRKSKMGKMPIVDGENRLVSMITRSDLKKIRDFPTMSRDTDGHLMVGAAVVANDEDDWERATALARAGVDVIFVNSLHSFGDRQLELLRKVKEEFPGTEVIAGPATCCREAKRLVEAGADAILVGSPTIPGVVGGVAAVGRPEATAVFEIARYVRLNYQMPAIAGPGVTNVGQLFKALCLGATAVMLGDPLAGTDEAPGNPVLCDGAWVKLHHGAGPLQAARPGSAGLPGLTATLQHSVSGHAAWKGSATALVAYMLRGVRCGMQDLGIRSVPLLHKALDAGDLRLECRAAFASRLQGGSGAAPGPLPMR